MSKSSQTVTDEVVAPLQGSFGNRLLLYPEVLRLYHWFKNIFVLIGSFAAFAYYDLAWHFSVGRDAALVFIASCFLSSVNYIINGIVDKPFDAKHPRKKYRAIPQGLLKTRELEIVAAVLLLGTLALSWFTLNHYCTVILFVFFLAGIVYNIRPLRTKDLPYLDVI